MLPLALKSVMARKLRLAMTAVAVVIGVSFMAGTLILTDTMHAAFTRLFAERAAGRETTVRAKSTYQGSGLDAVQRAFVPDRIVATIRAIPQVKSAEGTIDGYAQVVGKNGTAISNHGGPTVGTNWIADPELSLFRLQSGHPPTSSDQIAVDESTFNRGRFALGDRVTVLTAQAPRKFTVVGSVAFRRGGSSDPTTVVVFDGSTAQGLFGQPGAWAEIEVAGARPGVSAAQLTQRISDALPAQYAAVTASSLAAALARAVADGVGRVASFLLVFAGVSVIVGGFIIYNTFSILVAQRSRELALLRAIGATRRQVHTLVLAEASVVGVFASALGLGAGALFAFGMERIFVAAGYGLPPTNLQVLTRTVVLSVLLGSTVTVASSIIPAWRAARIPPVAAMTEIQLSGQASLRGRTVIGATIGILGILLMLLGLFAGLRQSTLIVGVAAAVVFSGAVLLSPWAVGPVTKAAGWPFRNDSRLSGRLSRENTVRNPKRTAASAGALMVGMALVTVVGTVGATMKATLSRMIDDSGRADYVVSTRPGSLFSAARLGGFTPGVAEALNRRPELAVVSPLRGGSWHSARSVLYLSAVDPATAPVAIKFRMTSGTVSSLAGGEVLIDAAAAKRRHVRVGDRLTMGFDATGPQNFRVGGIFKPNEFLESYVISQATFDQNYPRSPLDQELFIRDRSGPAVALAAIKRVTDSYPNLEVADQAAVKAEEQHRLDTVLNLGYVLLSFSIVVALVGIVNTLSLSIIERTRELGLLRAIGMRPIEIRRMVRGESILVCFMGGLMGVVVGVVVGVALAVAISFPGTKVVRVPVAQLAITVALAAACGVVAGVLPARRAANIDVLTAIAMP